MDKMQCYSLLNQVVHCTLKGEHDVYIAIAAAIQSDCNGCITALNTPSLRSYIAIHDITVTLKVKGLFSIFLNLH
jgi:hypothetical protein